MTGIEKWVKSNANIAIDRVLGEDTRRWLHFLAKKKYIIRRGLGFIHIPKAAGTSISRAIYGTRTGHFTIEEFNRYRSNKLEDIPLFSVIREPISRIVSSYNYAINSGGTDGTIRRDSAYSSAEFSDFNEFCVNWLAKQDMQRIDRIFWPQVEFLDPALENYGLDFVCTLEEISSLELYLKSSHGIDVKIQKLNNTKSAETHVQISQESKEIINSIYSDDFKLYNQIAGG